MICFPPSKINLGLNILEKRNDGYHNIESVLFPIPLFDVIEYRKAEKFSLQTYGIPVPGNITDNLLVKAYNLLNSRHQIPPLEINLLKNIPTGSGLGGGSSDAACLVKSANEVFGLDLNLKQLKETVSLLGMDCPFFIENMPSLVSGKGEIIEPVNISLGHITVVLVFTNIHIPTHEAYALIKPRTPQKSIREIISQPIDTWKKDLKNDFEEPIFKIHPKLMEIKNKLYRSGAIYASMTGSGSAIYGFFMSKQPNITDLKEYRVWSCELE